MSLVDEAKAEGRKGPPCTVGALISSDPKGIGAELIEAIADPECTGAGIARAVAKRGYRLNAEPILRHRRGECQCD